MAKETPPAAPVSPARPEHSLLARAGRGLRRLVLWSLLLVIAAGALYLLFALNYVYASGDRAGYVQKFSKKGWICKTWEGELAMANLPGAMPEVFAFSVRDDAVAAEVNKHLGARVTLHYDQHLGLPSCVGETSYFVTGVRPVGN